MQKDGWQQNCAQHDRCHRSSVVLNKSRVPTREQTMQNRMLDRVVGLAVLADLWISFGTLQAKVALNKRPVRLQAAQMRTDVQTSPMFDVRPKSGISGIRATTDATLTIRVVSMSFVHSVVWLAFVKVAGGAGLQGCVSFGCVWPCRRQTGSRIARINSRDRSFEVGIRV